MELEVMMPSPAVDFNFDSATTSPYVTAPSSPQRFGNFSFFSAPTSPTYRGAASTFFNHHSTVPFTWEESPGVPKRSNDDDEPTITTGDHALTAEEEEDDADFAFDFSGHIEKPSLTADELFDGGKIKPLKPPPRLQYTDSFPGDSPRSPKSPKSPKRMFMEALSPKHRRKDFDPFSEALKQTVKEQPLPTPEIGRGRTQSRHKSSRSLSPFRVSDILFTEEETNPKNCKESSNSSTWYGKKWKLKDLFLFRSKSEGSTAASTRNESERKYAVLKKSSVGGIDEDVKNSSFRSTDSAGSSVGGSTSARMRRRVSAHELHYTANRAVAEEMKKKTFLPYKQGLLGCLRFHRSIPDISIGSVHRSE